MKEDLKKNNKSFNIIMAICILALNFCFIFFKGINNMDELWNFNFARNIASGLQPYRAFNIITTPLLPCIIAIFFKIFGEKVIVERALSFILFNCIIFLVYKVLKKITCNEVAILFCLGLLTLFYNVIFIDYNFLSLCIMLVMLLIEIKNIDKEKVKNNIGVDIVIGILAGLVVCTKHTIGCILLFIISMYKFLEIYHKADLMAVLKQSGVRMLCGLVTTLPFWIYLAVSHTFTDFLDQCIFGIKSFTHSNGIVIGIIGLVILFCIGCYLLVKKTKDKKINILYAYSLASFFICIPLVDKVHLALAIVIPAIFLTYVLYKKVENKLAPEFTKYMKAYCYMFVFILALTATVVIYSCLKSGRIETRVEEYKGIVISKEIKEMLNEVDVYIMQNKVNGKDVYILDGTSAYYNIPLAIYRKYYDLLLVGNLGSSGEDGIIEDIKSKENAIFLITDESIIEQNVNKVIEYVKQNYTLDGKVSVFNVYH